MTTSCRQASPVDLIHGPHIQRVAPSPSIPFALSQKRFSCYQAFAYTVRLSRLAFAFRKADRATDSTGEIGYIPAYRVRSYESHHDASPRTTKDRRESLLTWDKMVHRTRDRYVDENTSCHLNCPSSLYLGNPPVLHQIPFHVVFDKHPNFATNGSYSASIDIWICFLGGLFSMKLIPFSLRHCKPRDSEFLSPVSSAILIPEA